MIFSDKMLDEWIAEDINGIDLTTYLTDFDRETLDISFRARHMMTVSAVEPAAAVLRKCGCTVESAVKSGTSAVKDDLIIKAYGTPESVHAGWRIALNLMEYSSGIATRTRALVDAAKSVNSNIIVSGTRKSFPGARKLSVQALMAGGAVPHRLGLSETVLFFAAHYNMAGGLGILLSKMPQIRLKCMEKKIGIELESLSDIEKAVKAGVDTIQTDKMAPMQVREAVELVRSINPLCKVAAAGGINIDNAADYAASGADMLVTSWMYFGKPADIGAKIS